MEMPTYERRFYLSLFTDEVAKRNESSSNSSTSNGTKKTLSGEALKSRLRKNEIPNQ